MKNFINIIIVLIILFVIAWFTGVFENFGGGNSVPVNGDFGEGIESDGEELVGQFIPLAEGSENLEEGTPEFASSVAEEFMNALKISGEKIDGVSMVGIYEEELNGEDCYIVVFSLDGPEGEMEALVSVKGIEARLKTLSLI